MFGNKWFYRDIAVKLWIKCKEATELASRAMDLKLPFSGRLALKLHHLVCVHCARYARQLHQIRCLLRRETVVGLDDGAALSAPARQRIEAELQQKLDP